MTTHLLDANVLIALCVAEHEHHERASAWVDTVGRVALCPIVEGALLRFLIRLGETARTGSTVLAGVRALDRVEFWPDAISYVDAAPDDVRGYRQVTDAYLAALARSVAGARLATLDEGLAAAHPDVAVLLPGSATP